MKEEWELSDEPSFYHMITSPWIRTHAAGVRWGKSHFAVTRMTFYHVCQLMSLLHADPSNPSHLAQRESQNLYTGSPALPDGAFRHLLSFTFSSSCLVHSAPSARALFAFPPTWQAFPQTRDLRVLSPVPGLFSFHTFTLLASLDPSGLYANAFFRESLLWLPVRPNTSQSSAEFVSLGLITL